MEDKKVERGKKRRQKNRNKKKSEGKEIMYSGRNKELIRKFLRL